VAIELVIIGVVVLLLFGIFLVFLALRWETLATNKPLRWFAGAFGLLALAMFVVIVGIFLPELIFFLVAIGMVMLAYVAVHSGEKRKGKPKRFIFADGEESEVVDE
jgi:predicted membrane protein